MFEFMAGVDGKTLEWVVSSLRESERVFIIECNQAQHADIRYRLHQAKVSYLSCVIEKSNRVVLCVDKSRLSPEVIALIHQIVALSPYDEYGDLEGELDRYLKEALKQP